MNIVGERLKELRVNARYSQKQLAELCETTQATIGRYEMGVAEPPFQNYCGMQTSLTYLWIISSEERIIPRV